MEATPLLSGTVWICVFPSKKVTDPVGIGPWVFWNPETEAVTVIGVLDDVGTLGV